MDQDTVINLATQAMTLAVEVAGPMLVAGLVIGLAISIFQAVTSIQEQTLTFIPKIIALAVIIVVLGPWMLRQMVDYTENLYQSIPTLISGA
jgi:flagellar biosynthesis protein FliQ